MSFSVKLENRNAAALIHVTGEVDMDTFGKLEALLKKAAGNTDTIIVNLAECTNINSTGVGVIVNIHNIVKKRGGKVVITGLNTPKVKKVFEIMGWIKIFSVFDTVDAALNSF